MLGSFKPSVLQQQLREYHSISRVMKPRTSAVGSSLLNSHCSNFKYAYKITCFESNQKLIGIYLCLKNMNSFVQTIANNYQLQ